MVPTLTIPTMKTPVLQLETHFLSKLHMDWKPATDGSKSEIHATRCDFDYDAKTHRLEKHRRMLVFRVKAQELNSAQQPAGYTIDCEIGGLFALTEATPKGREEEFLRINGISILYGILRGMLSMATGPFQGGCFALPSVMPQEIVRDVEAKRKASNPHPSEATSQTSSVGA